jgi:hypothetical protein
MKFSYFRCYVEDVIQRNLYFLRILTSSIGMDGVTYKTSFLIFTGNVTGGITFVIMYGQNNTSQKYK